MAETISVIRTNIIIFGLARLDVIRDNHINDILVGDAELHVMRGASSLLGGAALSIRLQREIFRMRIAVFVVPVKECVPERHHLTDEHLLTHFPPRRIPYALLNLFRRSTQGLGRQVGVAVFGILDNHSTAHHAAPERRTVAPRPGRRNLAAFRLRNDDIGIARHRPYNAENLLQKAIDRKQRTGAALIVSPEIQSVPDQFSV